MDMTSTYISYHIIYVYNNDTNNINHENNGGGGDDDDDDDDNDNDDNENDDNDNYNDNENNNNEMKKCGSSCFVFTKSPVVWKFPISENNYSHIRCNLSFLISNFALTTS